MAIRPSPGNISSSYGMRNGRLHAGEDIGWAKGTRLVSPIAGTISYVGRWGNYGNVVQITNGKTEIRLAHLAKISVHRNQYVHEGQYVGEMGETGNAQGVHVHWEVRINDKLVNPATWLTQQQTKPAAPKPTKINKKRRTAMQLAYASKTERVVDVPGKSGVRHATYKNVTKYTLLQYNAHGYIELHTGSVKVLRAAEAQSGTALPTSAAGINSIKTQIDKLNGR